MFQLIHAFILILAIFVNTMHVSADTSIVTTFDIVNDLDTDYDFEKTPDSFKAIENVTDTLGTIHRLTWENPKDLPSSYEVEIYAAIEFEVYAPKDIHSKFYTTWAQIENSAARDWVIIDSPYAKVYECSTDETSCDVDFNALLKTIENYCIDTDSSSSVEDGDSLGNVFKDSVANINLVRVLSDWVTSKLGGDKLSDELCLYTYTVNNMDTAEFRFNKMKYFIRYKKAVQPQEPLQEDGKYHYYMETWKPLNRSAGKPSNEFAGLPSGVYTGLSYTGGEEFVTEKGSYLNYHVKYEIISPYPICLVSNDKLPNYIHSYYFYDYDGSMRYYPFNSTIRTRTESGVEDKGNCQLYALVNKSDDKNEVNSSYGGIFDSIPNLAALSMVANSGTYQSNIPIFAAAFSTAADDYLLTGKLEDSENGNSWFMPGAGYQYGQLLQNTVGFVDGGTSLDKNNQTERLDGVSDTNNGWLKKIYYLLKDNLINDDGDSWLAKIHKRLEWTNTYLKALIAENTIADLGGFIADFISDKLDAAVNGVLDTIEGAAIITAGKTITDAAQSKFPFSLYTDCVVLAEAFVAEPEVPHFTVRLKYADEIDEKVELDFKKFDKLAKASRSFCYLIFCAGLIKKTRDFVTMIDGGSKIS